MTRKILVLGASGFIGSKLVEKLNQKEDFEVISCSRSSGDFKVDITDPEQIEKLPQDVDIVVNTVGIGNINGLGYEKESYNSVNVEGVKNLAKKYSSEYFIHLSSLAALGLEKNLLSSTSNPDPKLAYSKSKLEAENAVRQNFERYTIIRPAEVFNRQNPPEMLRVSSRFGVIPTNRKKVLAVELDELVELLIKCIDQKPDSDIIAGEEFYPEELANEAGLECIKLYTPNFAIKTAGLLGEVGRILGLRLPGLQRAKSICIDKEADNQEFKSLINC